MTKKKNPYESQETTEIPEFLQHRQYVESIKEDVYDEDDYDEYEEDEKVSERRSVRLNDKAVYAAIIAFAVLLLLCLILFISNIRRGSALKAKEAEYNELVKTVSEKDATYQQKINELQAEIDKLKSGGSTVVPGDTTKETKYRIIADYVNVRSSIDANADNIVGSYSSGDIITVYGELVNDNLGRQWGNVGTNKWVCIFIDYGADGYAELVN